MARLKKEYRRAWMMRFVDLGDELITEVEAMLEKGRSAKEIDQEVEHILAKLNLGEFKEVVHHMAPE